MNRFMESHIVMDCYIFYFKDFQDQPIRIDRIFTSKTEAEDYALRHTDGLAYVVAPLIINKSDL